MPDLLADLCPACGVPMEAQPPPTRLFDDVRTCPLCGYLEAASGTLIVRLGTRRTEAS
jgi:hypothetical protein